MRMFIYLLCSLWLFTVQAAELKFEPATPIVEINKTIVLSVVGAVGTTVRWQPFDGKIQGEGNQVTYLAPDKVGKDAIMVMDSEGNQGMVTVVITPPNDFSVENAQWEVFTNRSEINALLLSENRKTLWVGTNGGLEKRDAQTGELQQVLLNTDGLPDNSIVSLLSDGQGGLWIGTGNGLARLSANGQWTVYDKNNSELPSNGVEALFSDGAGGLCVATTDNLFNYTTYLSADGKWNSINMGSSVLISALLTDGAGGVWMGSRGSKDFLYGNGLLHGTSDGQVTLYNKDNSDLPSNDVIALLNDKAGGMWIATLNGLAHLSVDGQWKIYRPNDSGLPHNRIKALLSDGMDGLWIGTQYGGLAHLSTNGAWTVYNKNNSGLPDNDISTLLSDGAGGVWIGTDGGNLVHLSVSGTWIVHDESSNGPSSNFVRALLSDGAGGLWIGTVDAGLMHLSTSREWTVYDATNSDLPRNWVEALLSDGAGGVWIGTQAAYDGLAHMSASGTWTIYNKGNSGLPDGGVRALANDGAGGVWIGTDLVLAHFGASGAWTVYDRDNSDLPPNMIWALLSDGAGGVWIGTNGGLAHLSASGEWTMYKQKNSGLPDNNVRVLLSDSVGGVWIGTYEGGLARLSVGGQWMVYNEDNSGLPDNWVRALLSDGAGGLWIGTEEGGLAHLSTSEQWTVYNETKSNLPDNSINALLSDGVEELWIGTGVYGHGLAHLTFGRTTELCTQTQIDATTCQAIQRGKNAAIIVAAGRAQETNTLWESTESITTRIYHTFYERGFDKSNIYYLSSKTWADFDGDGRDDRINRISEDRHLTLDDLKKSFEWAKGLGKLDQPLYFFFMDHGGEGELQLAPTLQISAEDLKPLLDDYQDATGNQLIVVLEACHSGSLIPKLIRKLPAPNRAIITSAKADEKAYFFEKKGFSRFFTDYLLKGTSFSEAFQLATRDQDKLRGKNLQFQTAGGTGMTTQTPQLDDNSDGKYDPTQDSNWLKTVYVNGEFTTADGHLSDRKSHSRDHVSCRSTHSTTS